MHRQKMKRTKIKRIASRMWPFTGNVCKTSSSTPNSPTDRKRTHQMCLITSPNSISYPHTADDWSCVHFCNNVAIQIYRHIFVSRSTPPYLLATATATATEVTKAKLCIFLYIIAYKLCRCHKLAVDFYFHLPCSIGAVSRYRRKRNAVILSTDNYYSPVGLSAIRRIQVLRYFEAGCQFTSLYFDFISKTKTKQKFCCFLWLRKLSFNFSIFSLFFTYFCRKKIHF